MQDPITIFGTPTCEETDALRALLISRSISFNEIDIEQDENASIFVMFLNAGFRSTPTVLFDGGSRKTILTEPTRKQIEDALSAAGY